eukprot:TRINITY_DN8469_c0_g1_i3.p1 TRINITY_DN8469_c0_g1~~TRINITY_DN8469_c0_g1_i3.p1  ORF type:complete len:164 (+),score=32.29 TRINITY_DN8469_c0_g1_i3:49-492(+)
MCIRDRRRVHGEEERLAQERLKWEKEVKEKLRQEEEVKAEQNRKERRERVEQRVKLWSVEMMDRLDKLEEEMSKRVERQQQAFGLIAESYRQRRANQEFDYYQNSVLSVVFGVIFGAAVGLTLFVRQPAAQNLIFYVTFLGSSFSYV